MSKIRTSALHIGDEIERAHHFQAGVCDDPSCGVHFLSFDCDDNPICNTVIARKDIPSLILYLTAVLGQRPSA